MFGWFGSSTKSTTVEETKKVMNYTPESLDVLLEYFQDLTGMDFNHKKDVILGKLKQFCLNNECFSFEELLEGSKKNEQKRRDLINFLTINETYFNREFPQIQALPKMINESSKKVEILSVPCSTGEEVYSIIIHLDEHSIFKDKFNITGLDIDSTVLQKAKDGVFSKRSLHRVEDATIQKYFSFENDSYCINTQLKNIPLFELSSIFELNNTKKYDYIFCRNLLIYFDEATKIRAIQSLISVLNTEGKIFFGHSDPIDETLKLKAYYEHGTKFYKKLEE